ncbi:DUF1326 domain-containing protein [bacterium]|nr:DUF1326 domain-containing protein [bacterium]
MPTKWNVKGLLFENCSCQVVCPGHFSFKQLCTYERCLGHWAIHINQGRFGEVVLKDLNAVIVFDAPQRMYDGGWTEVFYIDKRADLAQREAIEAILSGQAGGPWEILSRFVSNRLDTRFVPIEFDDQGREKRMWITDVFDTRVKAIRAKDDIGEVLLSNLFNQIHAPSQVVARGRTEYSDQEFKFTLEGSHATYSKFSWKR